MKNVQNHYSSNLGSRETSCETSPGLFWDTLYTEGNNYYTILYLYQYYTNFFGGFIHAYMNKSSEKKIGIVLE